MAVNGDMDAMCPSLTRDAASTAPANTDDKMERITCPSLTRDAASTAYTTPAIGEEMY